MIKYWPVALFILNFLTAWAAWSLRQLAKNEVAAAVARLQARDEALDATVDGHDTRITKVEGRVDVIEKDLVDLPTKADLARLEGEINAVREIGLRTERGVGRIEQFMMENKG